jgi:Secretion system C-terminal sorting domain/Domain of unknown function (DUF5060)
MIFFGSNGSGSLFDNTNGNINPYDPDQISVEATFHFTGQPDQTIYGFYYRDYSYSTPTMSATTAWVENTTTPYHWRVRFAPKYTGSWNVTLVVKINGIVRYTDNVGYNFSCVTSSNKGFLKVGPNNKYFQYSNGESVFPIGINTSVVPEKYDADNHKYLPIEYFDHREKTKKIASIGGGNYARTLFSPWSYEIEWEKLNIYDADPNYPLNTSNPYGTNRQALMWEFDKMLDMTKDNDIKITLSMETVEGFLTGIKNTTTGETWDNYIYGWLQSPYKKILLNNNYYLDDFFTNALVLNNYKKRIRYMIARWGYSVNIASFEIANETYLFSGNFSPINNNNNIFQNFNYANPLLTNWHSQISSYIKNASGLNHNEHLISASIDYYDNLGIGSLSTIDFNSRHCYSLYNNAQHIIYKDLRFFDVYNKPCQVGEFGSAHYSGCTNAAFGTGFENINPTFHNMLWSSSLSGSPTSGVEWWDQGIDNGIYLPHIPPIKYFFNGENLDQEKYKPKYDTSTNKLIEAFMLENNNAISSNKVLGWVHNVSYYWHNFTNANCSYYNPTFTANYNTSGCPSDYFFPSPSCPSDGQLGTIKVSNLLPNTSFGIEWYNPYIDGSKDYPLIRTDVQTSNANGELIITPPVMGTGGSPHDYAFKIRPIVTLPCSTNDIAYLGKNDNTSSYKEITLNNRCLYTGGVLRTINLQTNTDTWVENGIDYFNGWMDDNDKYFVGDVNNDQKDELVLVNTSYSGGAIRAVNTKTRANLSWIDHSVANGFNGWMDATDKMFLGDVNNDNKSDLVLVNTNYQSGAIRAVDVSTGNNISWILHNSNFSNLMDATDKMFLGDVNNDNKSELVLVNTAYGTNTTVAIRTIDVSTGAIINTIYHGSFSGWMDPTDKMFLADINNDNKQDLVLINTAYQIGSGAIRVIDLTTGGSLYTINHIVGLFNGWFDSNDKLLLEDINNDNKKDLICFNNTTNPADPVGHLFIYDITTNTTIKKVINAAFVGFLDCSDRVFAGNVSGNINKDILISNSNYTSTSGSFLVYDYSLNLVSVKNNNAYITGFTGWKDGEDVNSICTTIVANGAKIGVSASLTENLDMNLEPSENIKVYPNPSNKLIFVAGYHKSIRVYNEKGSEVLHLLESENESTLDFSNFSDGIYLIDIEDINGKIISNRILLKK